MAKKHVYSKDATGYGEFIYVDLLPDVRRARQFNVNVITALTFAVILGFVFIYMPYRDATFEQERLNGLNNDLQHEFTLTQEEFNGFEIDLEAISFDNDIDELTKLRINFNNFLDKVELIVTNNRGTIRTISYNSDTKELLVEVSIVNQYSYNTLNNQLLNLEWVESSVYSLPEDYGDSVEHTSVFTIGVDYNVE